MMDQFLRVYCGPYAALLICSDSIFSIGNIKINGSKNCIMTEIKIKSALKLNICTQFRTIGGPSFTPSSPLTSGALHASDIWLQKSKVNELRESSRRQSLGRNAILVPRFGKKRNSTVGLVGRSLI